MRQRKRIEALVDAEQAALRLAFGLLQASTDSTKNYAHFAAMHGKSCPHGCELFLPWHRAYLLDFENALRAAGGAATKDVTIPYWDWVLTPKLPDLFATDTAGGQPNSLFHPWRFPDGGHGCNRLPTFDDVNSVMQLSRFPDFGGSIPAGGQISSTYPGDLENIHGWVHLWVGQTMADTHFFAAPCDPIFWAHHSNVDRLWSEWQVQHAGQNPRNLNLTLAGLDSKPKVRDMLSIEDLGYEYVRDSQELGFEEKILRAGSRSQPARAAPESFRTATLRLARVKPVGNNPVPGLIDVRVGGADHPASRISLFGIHKHFPDSPPVDGDWKPCFQPVPHDHPCGTTSSLNIDVTEAIRRVSGSLTFEFSLLNPGMDETDSPLLAFDQADLTFR